MYWVIVVALILMGAGAGFLVGVAYGQEHLHDK